jgi:ORF6N domain
MGKEVIPIERIAGAILVIRPEKVMLDSGLAVLYGVTTGNLNNAVKRNAERFPADFMFQLEAEEVANLKFQFGISSWGGRRRLPYEIGFHVREKAARYRIRKRA